MRYNYIRLRKLKRNRSTYKNNWRTTVRIPKYMKRELYYENPVLHLRLRQKSAKYFNWQISYAPRTIFLRIVVWPTNLVWAHNHKRQRRMDIIRKILKSKIRRTARYLSASEPNLHIRINIIRNQSNVRVRLRFIRHALNWTPLHNKIAKVNITLPRAHGMRTLKKWAKRKKTLQKRRMRRLKKFHAY